MSIIKELNNKMVKTYFRECNLCSTYFHTSEKENYFCSDVCEERSRHLIKKTCINCLKSFTTMDSEARFCSLICEAMHKKLDKKTCKLCDKQLPFGIKSMSFCCETCKVEYGNILTKWHSMMKEGKLISLDVLRENYIKEKRNIVTNYETKKDNLPKIKKDNLSETKKESDGIH